MRNLGKIIKICVDTTIIMVYIITMERRKSARRNEMTKAGLIDVKEGCIDWEVMSDMIDIDDDGNEVYSDEYVRINNLFIKSEFRGQGFAKSLLEKAVQAIEKECPDMEIKIVCCPKEDCVDFDRLFAFYDSTKGISEVIAV